MSAAVYSALKKSSRNMCLLGGAPPNFRDRKSLTGETIESDKPSLFELIISRPRYLGFELNLDFSSSEIGTRSPVWFYLFIMFARDY
jgi:hypothetical protein